MSRYKFDNRILNHNDPGFSDALAQAYRSRQRPLCLCKRAGIPMYIACIATDRYIIKRMPGTGFEHHPDCDSYEIPATLSGRGALDQQAILEDQESGLTAIKLAFPLAKGASNKPVAQCISDEHHEATAEPNKLSLRSLLHLLYEDAGLNRWSPRMEGKRSWYTIHKYLTQALYGKMAKKHPLSEHLYIPDSFSKDRKDQQRAYRRRFFGQLDKKTIGIVVGELKAIEEAKHGMRLLVKHMPDTPLYFDRKLHDRIVRHFGTELAFHEEEDGAHVIVIATVLATAAGNLTVESLSMMMTDKQWLPFEGRTDLEFVQDLVRQKRRFIKTLRYNLKRDDIVASCLLTDCGEDPHAVFLIPPQADDHYASRVEEAVREDEAQTPNTIYDLRSAESLTLPEPARFHPAGEPVTQH